MNHHRLLKRTRQNISDLLKGKTNMAFELNKFIFVGNLGKDAIVTEDGGKSRTNFSVANSRTFTANGEKRTQTSWFPCVWYGEGGVKLQQWLVKGKPVLIEGRIEIRQYEKDGQQRSFTEVVVQSLQLLPDGSRNKDNARDEEDITEDEVPF